ncbi:MAG: TolC family protein [Salinivenus sp.]
MSSSLVAPHSMPLRGWGAVLLVTAVVGLAAPVPAGAQPDLGGRTDTTAVTFDEAVRIALDQNTDLRRAQASVRAGEAQARSEWLDFTPNLDASSNVQRQYGRNFSQVTGDFTSRSTDFLNMGANANLTVFNGFENVSSLREARTESMADEVNLQRTQREVVFTVMEQFINLVETREIVRVRREELDALQQQLRQVEEFVDSGSRPISELYQQQANVAEAEQALLQAQREREVAQTELIQTLQLNPRAPYDFRVPDPPGDSIETRTYDPSALIDEAFEERLDLRVAKADERAAEHGVQSARSQYYPSLSVGADYGTDWTNRPRPVPDPDDPDQTFEPGFSDQLDLNRGGSVSLSLNIPIFDQWQRETQVQQAEVQAQNAQYDLDDQQQQVALQVRQAYLDYRNAVQQLEAANARLQSAEQARTSAQERYNLGSASIVELQNANRDFVDAASQQVRARYTLLFRERQIDYFVGNLRPSSPLFGE